MLNNNKLYNVNKIIIVIFLAKLLKNHNFCKRELIVYVINYSKKIGSSCISMGK